MKMDMWTCPHICIILFINTIHTELFVEKMSWGKHPSDTCETLQITYFICLATAGNCWSAMGLIYMQIKRHGFSWVFGDWKPLQKALIFNFMQMSSKSTYSFNSFSVKEGNKWFTLYYLVWGYHLSIFIYSPNKICDTRFCCLDIFYILFDFSKHTF